MTPGLPKERLASLDAFRGITIAGMILVNNPGSWQHVYPPLRHAAWHGWTPTDLVFPFFLFIVGVAVALALGRRVDEGISSGGIHRKIVVRSALIFGVGLALHLFPRFDFAGMRIPGVLQRIAVCYLAAALLYIHAGPRARIAWVLALLAGYFLIMRFVPVPGYGAGVWDYDGNLESYIDTKLLAGHLYKPEFDPEGFLSTLPSIATAILGTLAGDWLRTSRRAAAKAAGLAGAGVILTAAGLALHPYFPINKQLWTSSFVLFTAGAACLLLAACYLVMDGLRLRKWALPFTVFGTNAIAAYVGSSAMIKLLRLVKLGSGAERTDALAWVYQHAFVPWAGDLNGSLAFAITLRRSLDGPHDHPLPKKDLHQAVTEALKNRDGGKPMTQRQSKAAPGRATLAVLLGAASLVLLFSCRGGRPAAGPPPAPGVKPGLEVFLESRLDLVKGKRVGLIVNPTGVDRRLRSSIELLKSAAGAEHRRPLRPGARGPGRRPGGRVRAVLYRP